jgi:hypothetical protein
MKLLHLYYVSIGIYLPEHELFCGSVCSVWTALAFLGSEFEAISSGRHASFCSRDLFL